MSDAPRYRDYSLMALVLGADPEHFETEIVYEFGYGRQFESTDRKSSGIYGLQDLLLEGSILLESGDSILLESGDEMLLE